MEKNEVLPKLSVVIPCYNEEENLPETSRRLLRILEQLIGAGKIGPESYLLFVDDGSRDASWAIMEQLAKSSPHIKGLKLSRNFGHQNALIAGMESAQDRCDCMVSIDADLQQDENAIETFIEKFRGGADIVLGIRKDRDTDPPFKKMTALFFYSLMHAMGVDVVRNHADYRLLSQRVVKALLGFRERNLFLRGLVPFVGFRTEYVLFDVRDRYRGQSKYPLRKMLSFAFDAITSFSVVPLRFFAVTGLLVFAGSLLMTGYIFYLALFTHRTVPGWASTVLPIYFIGGVELLALGVIGEYIGRLYRETKARPRYFIDKELP